MLLISPKEHHAVVGGTFAIHVAGGPWLFYHTQVVGRKSQVHEQGRDQKDKGTERTNVSSVKIYWLFHFGYEV